MFNPKAVLGTLSFTGATAAITNNSGFASGVVRNAQGDWTVTHRAVDTTEAQPILTSLNATALGGYSAEVVSDTQTRFRQNNATGAALADPTTVQITWVKTRF